MIIVRRLPQGKRLPQALRFGMAIPQSWAGNTITNLLPILYEALDQVSRELVGFINAVSRDSSAERAAKGQVINIPSAPANAAADITPGVTAPNDGDQSFGNIAMTISKSRYAPVRWNGEEQKQVEGTGMRQKLVQQQFEQAMRTLVNEVERDQANLYKLASRAYGTAGTTPFGTAVDFSDAAQLRKILEDNGAPTGDLHLVLGTAAIANIRGKQSGLFKVNEAGTAELLRQGIIGSIEGWNIHTSAQIQTTVKGTGASYTSNSAGYAVGATVITLITGAGTVLAGDTVTFAGDTNKYVVAVGTAAPGPITLALPGLQVAIPAAPTALTVGNNAAQNMGFARSALHLITRAPAMPDGGDAADDVIEITDDVSGLAFQVAMYRQYRQVRFEVGLAWGQQVSKAEHLDVLLG